MLSHTLTGNRGRYATVFDEDGRTVIQVIDVDQGHAFEWVASAFPGSLDPVRVEMPNLLPAERGTWVIEADGSTNFRTPDEHSEADIDEANAVTSFGETNIALDLQAAALNKIIRSLQGAGIMREDDVAVIPSIAELVPSTDMNIFTPSPAEAGTETDTEFDNGILAEARCICVDPIVVIA